MRKRIGESPAMIVAATALVVAVIGTASTTVASQDGASAGKTKPPQGTVVVAKKAVSNIQPGSVAEVEAKCPDGYRVLGGSYAIGGSVLAHASVAATFSKDNSYATYVTNPPANPAGGVPNQEAEVTIGAICAKKGQPVVLVGPFRSTPG